MGMKRKISRRKALSKALQIAGASVSALSIAALGKNNALSTQERVGESRFDRSLSPAGQQAARVKDLAWPKLVAHWKLDGNCRDSVGAHHGDGNSIKFVNGRDGRPEAAALFNGLDGFIEVAHDEELLWGTREFSVAFWVNLEEDVVSVIGDVLSKYDPAHRRGVNISIAGSSPNGCSVCNVRNIHFGVDTGINGSWVDCGRPWKSNPLISTLTVYKGKLYTGIADASRPEDACHVFWYAGGTDWVDCGQLGSNPLTPTVYSMIVHKGQLYAGTGVWDWRKAIAGIGGPDHVYRYEGGTQWRDCGQLGNGYRTQSLASFKGDLYAGDDTGRCYRYDGDRSWSFAGQLGNDNRINNMMVYRGHLYGTSHPAVYRYDGGTSWVCIGRELFGTQQTYKLQVYDGHLYVGTWPFGRVLRYEGENRWTDCGQLGIATDKFQINEVNDLTVYNGKLYAGVLPKAEVYRYERDTNWTLLRRLVQGADWNPASLPTWSRVPCLTVFQGRLFMGTSTCIGNYDPTAPAETGRVYAMEAGKNVSLDDDLGAGWKHVIAVKERGRLKLYVNGELSVTSSSFDNSDYDLSTRGSLLIGLGAQNYFSGTLADIRIYGGALNVDHAAALYRGTHE
jgi:hypothetical protein